MIILNDSNQPIQAECHFQTMNGQFQIVIESSGGANKVPGSLRRNPDYNDLLFYALKRIGSSDCKITSIYLDSANEKVKSAPITERIIPIETGYPFTTRSMTDDKIQEIRALISRNLSLMFRSPTAKSKSGNGQKRIAITLSKPISFKGL